MQPTLPKDVTHYCRTCGFEANSRKGASAHAVVRNHYGVKHVDLMHRPYPKCSANCGLKASFEEKKAGRMLHGAYALGQKRAKQDAAAARRRPS